MKQVLIFLAAILIAFPCFSQFSDTSALNTYIKDTIRDRRPDKVTAAQLQKSLLGIVSFLPLTTPLTAKQIAYGNSSSVLTGNPAFTFNDTTNTLYSDTMSSKRVNLTGNININQGVINMTTTGISGHINITGNQDGWPRVVITNSANTASAGAGVLFTNDAGYSFQQYMGSTLNAFVPGGALIRTTGPGGFNIVADAGPIAFGKNAGMGLNEFARFTTTGRLGIGTTNPQRQLDITGSIGLPGSTGTNGVIYLANSPFLHAFTAAGIDPGIAGTNTFLGKNSGNFSMTGSGLSGAIYNTGIGNTALTALTSGYNNVSVGYMSAKAVTTGINNTVVGSQALYSATTGSDNVAIGSFALLNATGNGNVGVGSGSLSSATGSNNISVGNNTGGPTSGQFNIVLGAYARVPVNTGTGQLNIGNVLYGSGLYATASNSSTPTTSGKIGIGLTTPTAVLHLKAGTASANTAPFKYTAGTNLTFVEDGAKEFDGTNEFLSAGGVRYTLAKTLTATGSLDFPSTTNGESSDLTITVTGAADGDIVYVGTPNAAVHANTCYTAFVSAANTVTVRFNNYSAAAVDPASGTFRVSVLKY